MKLSQTGLKDFLVIFNLCCLAKTRKKDIKLVEAAVGRFLEDEYGENRIYWC